MWAIVFDGEGHHRALKAEYPISQCSFAQDDFNIVIGDAVLMSGIVHGCIAYGDETIQWDVTYSGEQRPAFFVPGQNQHCKTSKSKKTLVGLPFARFNGSIQVNGETIEIINWVGSQNHNWGSKHTDHYAWGQVCGFDNEPDAFLELATFRIKIGPLFTPFMTPLVVIQRKRICTQFVIKLAMQGAVWLFLLGL